MHTKKPVSHQSCRSMKAVHPCAWRFIAGWDKRCCILRAYFGELPDDAALLKLESPRGLVDADGSSGRGEGVITLCGIPQMLERPR